MGKSQTTRVFVNGVLVEENTRRNRSSSANPDPSGTASRGYSHVPAPSRERRRSGSVSYVPAPDLGHHRTSPRERPSDNRPPLSSSSTWNTGHHVSRDAWHQPTRSNTYSHPRPTSSSRSVPRYPQSSGKYQNPYQEPFKPYYSTSKSSYANEYPGHPMPHRHHTTQFETRRSSSSVPRADPVRSDGWQTFTDRKTQMPSGFEELTSKLILLNDTIHGEYGWLQKLAISDKFREFSNGFRGSEKDTDIWLSKCLNYLSKQAKFSDDEIKWEHFKWGFDTLRKMMGPEYRANKAKLDAEMEEDQRRSEPQYEVPRGRGRRREL